MRGYLYEPYSQINVNVVEIEWCIVSKVGYLDWLLHYPISKDPVRLEC